MVAALTIQLYEQRGLLPEQVDQLINQLVKEHKKERSWNRDLSKPTKAEKWLNHLIPTIKFIQDLTPEMKLSLRLDERFTRSPVAIKKFLHDFALPQITVPKSRITSTAADMQAGFSRSIMLSATPSMPEIYPSFLDLENNCFLDEAFEAEVISTLLQEQNRRLFVLRETQGPAAFFDQFPEDLLKKMTTLIDRGSLLTHFDANDIITAYLDLEKSRTSTQTAAFFSKQQKHTKQQMRLVSKALDVKNVSISGAALIEALKKQGKNPEEFLLFLFLDLCKTTGTDIARPQLDHAGLTVGLEQTLTETQQAAMRQRKLLDKNAQSISWLMFQALYREINPGTPEGCALISMTSPPNVNLLNTLPIRSNAAYIYCNDQLFYVNKANNECTQVPLTKQQQMEFYQTMKPANEAITLSNQALEKIKTITDHTLPKAFDPIQLFYWMLKNEAKKLESKLISRAYQDIYQAISALAWQEVRKHPESIDTDKKGLEQKQDLSPAKIYEIPSKNDKTEVVLRKYVTELLLRFKLNIDDLPLQTKLRISKVIKQTSRLIPELQDPPKTQLGVEVEQEMQQEQQEEQEQQQELVIKNKNDSTSDFVFAVEEYNPDLDNLIEVFNQSADLSNQWYQMPRLLECEGINLPALVLHPKHFTVTKQHKMNVDSPLTQLKPIHNLLVRIMPDNQMRFVACTARDMEYFAEQINENNITDKYPAYAIIGIDGAIFFKSNNVPLSDLSTLIAGEECKKMLTYSHFLNGEISDPIILSQIAKEQRWDKNKYERLANAIADVRVSHQPLSLLNNEVFETLAGHCGWDNKKPSTSTASADYRKPADERTSRVPQQALRPVATLENHIENTDRPIMTTKHALGSDLLGKTPKPIITRALTARRHAAHPGMRG